jgi:hypothetical protein
MTADSCSGVRAVGARGMRAGAGSVLFLVILTEEVLMVVEVLGYCQLVNGYICRQETD